MDERKELLKIPQLPHAIGEFISHIDDDYKTIRVLIVEHPSKKFIIFGVDENLTSKTGSPCFKVLENVIDYKYDKFHTILLANVETSAELKTGYWTAFSVSNVIFNFLLGTECSFDGFLKVPYFQEVPEAFFREDFSYLPTARMVQIADKNYLINYSFWHELYEVKPLYYDRFLDIGSAGTTLYSSFNELKTLFGPFPFIIPFEEGTYPYFATCFHGYWGKNEDGNITGIFITHDETYFEPEFSQKQPFRMNSEEYGYCITFKEPLKSLTFFSRDWEKKDFINKNHCARDIWKLTYPDGSKAVMFHSIGNHDFSYGSWFTYFILKESRTKEYFTD